MKLCKDCKHYRPPMRQFFVTQRDECCHPLQMETNPVNGQQHRIDCSTPWLLRKYGPCGMEAVYFEPLQASVQPTPAREGGSGA